MNIRNFDLNLLRYFDALLTDLNVSHAARRLNLSQPAMSNALGRLRHFLADPVLVRAGSRMVATPLALRLHGPVRDILNSAQTAFNSMVDFEPLVADNTFEVGVSHYAEYVVLPGLLAKLREVAPGVNLVIRNLNEETLTEYLLDGKIDLAVVFSRGLQPTFHARDLLEDNYVCIARRSKDSGFDLAAYLECSHISLAQSLNAINRIDETLARLGHRRKVALWSTNFYSAARIVSTSDLVATVPRRIADEFKDQNAFNIFPVPFEIAPLKLVQTWHERVHTDLAHKWLRGVVQEQCAGILQKDA